MLDRPGHNMASSAALEGADLMLPESRVGRRRSTTPQHIADVAIELFAARGLPK